MFRFRLKQLRDEHNLSQYDLADELDIKQSTIAMWENGTNAPRQATLIKIAEYFDVSVDYLLGKEKKSPENSDDRYSEFLKTFNLLDDELKQKIIDYADFVRSRDADK